MKFLFFTAILGYVLNISCSKIKEYQDPLSEERLSIEFLIPPSLGSPYKAGDPLFISLIMAANKVQVSRLDISFSDQSVTLATVQINSISTSPILNDKLWTVRYSAGIMYSIPLQWSGKTITVTALANGISTKSSFRVN